MPTDSAQDLPTPAVQPLDVSSPVPLDVSSPVPIQSTMPIPSMASQLANENLQVYIRRKKRHELEHRSQPIRGQGIDSIPNIDDFDMPIALRKGIRRCTSHPIGNNVTYYL